MYCILTDCTLFQLLRPLQDASDSGEGCVSIDVWPESARDSRATLAEAAQTLNSYY
jgi:hypothetical protein